MGIFSQVKGPIRRILNELLDDDDLSELLTYYLYVGQAFDDVLGHNVDRFEIYSVMGSRLRYDLNGRPVRESSIEGGDMFFLFRYDDLPETISTKDRIVDADDVEFKIVEINKIFKLATSMRVDGS